MREIKFRAWNKTRGEMSPVALMDLNREEGYVVVEDGHEWNKDPETGEADCVINNKDLELMQYTGLKDKNGKEIYEGDIIKGLQRVGDEHGTKLEEIKPFVVEYKESNGMSVIGFDFKMCELNSLEILGNIYENPELLK